MKTILFLILLPATLFAQATNVTFVVEVPDSTDVVYITGNQDALGNWDPTKLKLEKTTDLKRSITLPVTLPAEFKFTRGSWENEGYTGDKWNTENLRLETAVPHTEYKILGWFDEDKFFFTDAYIAANKGQYAIEVPEVQELVHILFTLTATGRADHNLVNHEGDYYGKVLEKFGSYSSDLLVENLNTKLEQGMYSILKMDACGFYFDGDTIKKDSIISKLGWGGPNHLEPFIPELQRFALETGFREFYRQHTPYYNELIKRMDSQTAIRDQWDWLENNFRTKYDNYRITFSPLVNGSHSTNNFVQDNFRQTVMFIRGPLEKKEYKKEVLEGMMSGIIFTEIDHNYVNPVSDGYTAEIKAAMPRLSDWASPAALKYYTNEYLVFNEYMTWAVFTLYTRSKFKIADFEAINAHIENLMMNGRGFVKFKEFNRSLQEIYDNRKGEERIEDLYPAVLKSLETI